MDIHRCRFVPYQPQSINALAFTHTISRQRTPTDLRLAVGRENGNVEIWNPSGGKWFQEKIFHGSHGRNIEQLTWTQDLLVDTDNKEQPIQIANLRLFSSGGSASITEWDLGAGVPKVHAEGNFGDIWCFAAQPQWQASAKRSSLSQVAAAPNQLLAAGSSDGTILLFSTADDTLQYMRTLFQAPSKKSKTICITWRDRDTVVAGFENGTIKVLSVSSRAVIRTMSLGRPANDNHAVVWAVKCLPDGAIVSGDSTGELKIWDATNYSLVQRLKSHDADILDVAVNATGDLIVTAGVDRRTVVYRRDAQQNDQTERWLEAMQRRFHQHDVKALAAFESKEMSILASGGIDTAPIIVPLQNFDKQYHRTLPHLPQRPQMSASSKARLMLTWWQRDLLLWQIPQRRLGQDSYSMARVQSADRKPIARLQLSGDEYVSSAQLSDNGRMIVAATSKGVKVFQIRKMQPAGNVEIKMRPVPLSSGIASFGATLVGFSHDSKWLYAVRASNVIALVKIVNESSPKDRLSIDERIVKLERKERKTPLGKLGNYRLSINCVAFSSDSRVLCVGDLSGAIDSWILEGREDPNERPVMATKKVADDSSDSSAGSDGSDSDSDSDDEHDSIVIHGQKWVRNPGPGLPLLDSAILALSFKPLSHPQNSDDAALDSHTTQHNMNPASHHHPSLTKLIVITASHAITEFDVISAKMTDWSRRNPPSRLPDKFIQVKDRAMGMFWDCRPAHQRLYIFGPAFVFMLDLAHDVNMINAQETIGKLGPYDVHEPSSTVSESRPAARIKNMRQYDGEITRKKRKIGNAAGDGIKYHQWQASETVARNRESHLTTDDSDRTDIDSVSISDNDDDVVAIGTEDMDLATLRLTSLRRETNNNPMKYGTGKVSQQDNMSSPSVVAASLTQFMTYRYRSILGVTAISPSFGTVSNAPNALHNGQQNEHDLEIIVVERPLYDIDLVPRFDGDQEW